MRPDSPEFIAAAQAQENDILPRDQNGGYARSWRFQGWTVLRLCALRKPRSTRPTTAGGSKKRRTEGQGVQLQDTGPQDGVGTAGGVRGNAVNFMSARRGSPCRAGGVDSQRLALRANRGHAFSRGLTVRRGERPSRQSTCVALRGALKQDVVLRASQ